MSKERSGEAESIFKMVQVKYGDRLNASELEEVRKGVDAIVEAVESMRSAKLANGDEPDFTFRPHKQEG